MRGAWWILLLLLPLTTASEDTYVPDARNQTYYLDSTASGVEGFPNAFALVQEEPNNNVLGTAPSIPLLEALGLTGDQDLWLTPEALELDSLIRSDADVWLSVVTQIGLFGKLDVSLVATEGTTLQTLGTTTVQTGALSVNSLVRATIPVAGTPIRAGQHLGLLVETEGTVVASVVQFHQPTEPSRISNLALQVLDSDDDGVPDTTEHQLGTDPYRPDNEGQDSDGDGASDEQERLAGTDPNDADSDGDGVSDGDEIARGYDPLDSQDTPVITTEPLIEPSAPRRSLGVVFVIVGGSLIMMALALGTRRS